MANTPNLNLPQQSNWTSGLVKDWAKAINDENDANNAFKKIDDFAGNTNNALNGKEASANKQTSIPASPDDTHYPSSKAVKDYVDAHGGPDAYIKSATVSQDGNTLTLTKEDDTTIPFTPSGSGAYHGMPISSTVAWGFETPAGTITPDLTLPNVPNPRTEATELVYIFTAASANADFTPPSAYILGDEEDGFVGMNPGDTISYTNLTIGSIYEVSFKVLDSTHISLIKKEHKTA